MGNGSRATAAESWQLGSKRIFPELSIFAEGSARSVPRVSDGVVGYSNSSCLVGWMYNSNSFVLRLAGANYTCLRSADFCPAVESDPHDMVVVPVPLCVFLLARSASLLGFSHALFIAGTIVTRTARPREEDRSSRR